MNPIPVVETADLKDASEICKLLNLCLKKRDQTMDQLQAKTGFHPAQVEQAMKRAGVTFKVLKVDAKIIGCIQIEKIRQDAVLSCFTIAHQWRRKKWGRQLLHEAEIFANRVYEIQNWVLYTDRRQPALVHYYQARGYQVSQNLINLLRPQTPEGLAEIPADLVKLVKTVERID